MKHLFFTETQLDKLDFYSKKWDCTVLCKRDDLFLYAGGGSKSRMLQYILYPIIEKNIKHILTAGGPCSNFNRALALLCAKYGISLKLISYTDNKEEYNNSFNHFIVEQTGTDITFCEKNKVVETINKELDFYRENNIDVKYIYGGGKSLEGIYAYYDAVRELKEQYKGKIDELYVACGTGTTLTGIYAGIKQFFPKTEVHAISVARKFIDEKPVLEENIDLLNSYLNTKINLNDLIFHEDFLSGGYGKVNKNEIFAIKECISKQGLLVDPTYSGKAFWGMKSIIEEKRNLGKTVLFWNTGALFNLSSQQNEFFNI